MTHISFWLEGRLGTGLEQKRLKLQFIKPSPDFGPYSLKEWAQKEALDIEYIDNCFLKVAAPRAKVAELLPQIYRHDSAILNDAISTLGPEWEIVLVAEEF